MANRIQHLRGSHTEHSTFTGEKGEISLVTDTSANRIPTGELRVHDGSTAGGLPVKLGTTDKPLTSNIVMGSGYGINFASYATSGNPSSNLLDDYETGTWSPSITADGNAGNASSSGSFSTIGGNYTKIGNMVFLEAEINFDTKTAVSTYLVMTNIPFTANASYRSFSGNNDEMPNVLSRRNDTGGIISNGRIDGTGRIIFFGLTAGQGGEFSFTTYFRTT